MENFHGLKQLGDAVMPPVNLPGFKAVGHPLRMWTVHVVHVQLSAALTSEGVMYGTSKIG